MARNPPPPPPPMRCLKRNKGFGTRCIFGADLGNQRREKPLLPRERRGLRMVAGGAPLWGERRLSRYIYQARRRPCGDRWA